LNRPLQNRVLPTGEIVADPARGTMTGNRGILHDDQGRLTRRRWTHKAWICCVLDWQGRKRAIMTGRTWTELFFLDEAVAMAAGHRPCGYCRRADYADFRAAWGGAPRAPEMDAVLHHDRLAGRVQRRNIMAMEDVPVGAMIMLGGTPMLVCGDRLLPYAPDGYGAPLPRPKAQTVACLTPAALCRVLAAGYRPKLHASALTDA